MKNKVISIVFGAIGLIVVLACLYVGITYLGFIGKALIEFFSPGNIQAMNGCGIETPQEFIDIRNQLPTTLLPAIYIGIPLSLILISAMMFFSGYYFGKHKVEHELDAHIQREEEIEQEVKKRTGKEEKPEKAKKGKKE